MEQEVCHRGFAGIVTTLVKAGAEVSHIPDPGAAGGAHIMRGAPHSPLGEAARGGFKGVRGAASDDLMPHSVI